MAPKLHIFSNVSRGGTRSFLVLSLMSILFGCGGSESTVSPNVDSDIVANGKTFQLRAFSPITYQLNPASPDDPNQLVSGSSPLQLFQYQGLSLPELDATKQLTTSVITGLGIDVVDLSGAPLSTSLVLVARQYDSLTGSFSANFQYFADKPNTDVQRGQNFSISNTNSPSYVFSGLGMSLKNARLANFQVQKKTFANLGRSGRAIEAGTYVSLPAGWVMTGLIIRIAPGSTTSAIPFVQDIVIYPSQLVQQ